MIVSALCWAIIWAAFKQPNATRQQTALCFVLPLIVSELFYTYFVGEIYYFWSSLIAILISFLLRFMSAPTRLSLNLQLICMASIILNAFGWALYRLKFQPDIYNDSFIIVYSITFLIMIVGGGWCVGNNRMDFGRPGFSRHASTMPRNLP